MIDFSLYYVWTVHFCEFGSNVFALCVVQNLDFKIHTSNLRIMLHEVSLDHSDNQVNRISPDKGALRNALYRALFHFLLEKIMPQVLNKIRFSRRSPLHMMANMPLLP
ncbi:hypothetical protein SDC9_67554 [bioreactor metagenome]|jgi:hypothetical protein|uniref:Uncharacterized protein n=1 Tax=bioreactor metagenome TaxID=1076179 RepID=A0A644XZM2_9ZZZZ